MPIPVRESTVFTFMVAQTLQFQSNMIIDETWNSVNWQGSASIRKERSKKPIFLLRELERWPVLGQNEIESNIHYPIRNYSSKIQRKSFFSSFKHNTDVSFFLADRRPGLVNRKGSTNQQRDLKFQHKCIDQSVEGENYRVATQILSFHLLSVPTYFSNRLQV